MSKAVLTSGAVVMTLVLALVSGPAVGQSGVSVQLALDKPVDLNITDAPISQVFQKLTQATGVRFVIGQDVYACLPYGDQTRLAVKLKNGLREELFNKINCLGPIFLKGDKAGELTTKQALSLL